MRGEYARLGVETITRGKTSQRDRQQSPDHRTVSGTRPALIEMPWKKASRPVRGWGAVPNRLGQKGGNENNARFTQNAA